uniref:Uncharacterized protein n=1 Tax=Rhizophora mucronata TaxID=61149 RepID=A0A2P2QRE5_RHIMU
MYNCLCIRNADGWIDL